jgi:4-alpha-glucanotransferase
MRTTGILLHVSSLPSPYGIGTFGKTAYDFVDFLHHSNQTYWQILPLGHTSYGDSPYQTFSAFAYNPYFIDLDFLVKDGLIQPHEINLFVSDERHIDFGYLYHQRYIILRKAFNRFDLNNQAYQDFIKKESLWLHDYALFMAIKGHFGGNAWSTWDLDIKLREKNALSDYQERLKTDIDFYTFLQFKAYSQWNDLKTYANQKGIKIIGDMPIYVAYDSSDVWANSKYFDLDELKTPYHVAGVPPDNYSADGQLWGNPIYNWRLLKEENYIWWVNRVQSAMESFDMIRIDHFIGFVNYYQIPYGELTAKYGKWIKGPGYQLFKVIKEQVKNVSIIAEDLGVVTQEVRNLLKKTKFPGMKLLQFAFYSKDDNEYLPHHYIPNVVAYTGTHDNETTQQWFNSLSLENRNYCLDYINHQTGSMTDSLIKATLASVANIAIIPMQDYLNLGSIGRMNTPSTSTSNWRWRLLSHEINEVLYNKIKYLTNLYHRERKDEQN